MSFTNELPANIQSVVDKVEKLLRLAANNPNEAEASSAAAKAQELLAAYNLDMTIIGQAGGKTDRREDRKLTGGLYKWQRELWEAVADLNFCLYRSIKGLEKGSKYEHRLIGRTANILSTRLMAEYLEQAIERITRERFDNNPSIYFSKDGIAYREGMADRIAERLRDKRRQAEREAQAAKAAERASHPTSTALTIVDVKKSEFNANQEYEYDQRHGPGAYQELHRAHQQWQVDTARRMREAEEAAERFKLEHPEEYAAMEAAAEKLREKERKREERNARRRTGGGRSYKGWSPRSDTFYEGKERGNDVSLDKQVDRNSTPKIGR